jgi:hypothetical protein
MKKYSYRKRSFLIPASSGASYVLAGVESSKALQEGTGQCLISLAEGDRQVHLEFPLETEEDRRNSLAKIELLTEVFVGFGLALTKEAELISRGKSTSKPDPQ